MQAFDAAGAPLPAQYPYRHRPDDIVASEFLTMEGKKFSSSRKVVIYVRDFLERYDADALRYFIAAAGTESNGTDFTWAEFVRRNNDELVAAWGNLVNRVLTFTYRNFDGTVPEPGPLREADTALLAATDQALAAVGHHPVLIHQLLFWYSDRFGCMAEHEGVQVYHHGQ